MKLSAVFRGSEGSSLSEPIVACVVVPMTIWGVRGWIPVTGSECARYHAKTRPRC